MIIYTTNEIVELTLSSNNMSKLLNHERISCSDVDGKRLVIFFPLKG